MFDLIGFDLDGTLVNSAPDLANATNHALVRGGRPAVPVESVAGFMGGGARLMLARALAATSEDVAENAVLLDRLLPDLLAYYAAHIADETRPYPGVEGALDRLQAAGARLAICTNKREDLARALIAALGWGGRFVTIIGGDTTPAMKPDPTPLAVMIERAGGGRTLFVGDTDNDSRAAQALGLPVILFASGTYSPADLAPLGADAIITDFARLFAVAESLSGSRMTGGQLA